MAYTTTATTQGGRNGRAVLANGGLALAMALPKEMGGSGDGHNPEQLFALGYSSCFGQAILALAKKHEIDGARYPRRKNDHSGHRSGVGIRGGEPTGSPHHPQQRLICAVVGRGGEKRRGSKPGNRQCHAHDRHVK